MRCRLALFTAVHVWMIAIVGIALSTTAGCLSLGGTTTHVHENPDLKARVISLESRVGTLEEAMHGSAPQPLASAP